jgi:DNA-binding response OmpR family regulator
MLQAADTNIIRAQREKIDELEETIRQLREQFKRCIVFPSAWKLRPTMTRILTSLYLSRGAVRHEALQEFVKAESDDPSGAVHVQICNLRKCMTPLGIQIHCRREFGYELDQSARPIIRAALEQAEAAE